jgi:hypothetical protein
MPKPKIKTDTYKITAAEFAELLEAHDDYTRALDACIEIARERARIYAIPAQWEAIYNSHDQSVTVKRYRNG